MSDDNAFYNSLDGNIFPYRDRLGESKEFSTYSEMEKGLKSESCNNCGGWDFYGRFMVGESKHSTTGVGHDGTELDITIFECEGCGAERGRWEERVASGALDSIEDSFLDSPLEDDDPENLNKVFELGAESQDEPDWCVLDVVDRGEKLSRDLSTHSGPKIEIRKSYVTGDVPCRMYPKKQRSHDYDTSGELGVGDLVRAKEQSETDGDVSSRPEILDPYSGDFPWPPDFQRRPGVVVCPTPEHGDCYLTDSCPLCDEEEVRDDQTVLVRFKTKDRDWEFPIDRSNVTLTDKKIEILKRNKDKIGDGGWGHSQFPEFKARSMAKGFLGKGGGKVGLELQRVFPDIDWLVKVTGAIWGANVNRRRLMKTEDKVKLEAHSRTRWCIETYVRMTCERRSFWFFSDFLNKFLVNELQADNHLSEGHPFNRLLILGDVEKRNEYIMKGNLESPKKVDESQVRSILGALSRQLGFDPWTDLGDLLIEEVPDDIWDKIELRGKHDSEGVGLRYWVPYEDEERSEEGGEIWVSGGLRKQGLLHLSHIPVAYVVAQMIYDHGLEKGIENHRHKAAKILGLIHADLDWCEADRATMDEWWEGVVATRKGSPESSVTRMGH